MTKANNTETTLNQIFVGVASTLIGVMCLGLFKMHTDIEITKTRIDAHDKALTRQAEYVDKFDEMLKRFDKALAIQASTVDTLKTTIDRMEEDRRLANRSKK